MAAGDVHGDGSYSLEEEIELLEAIYIHELTLEGARERPTAVSVLLHPSTGDEEDKRFVCLTLVIYLPDKYPLELPSIHIKTPRGLSEAHVESILANLRELAEGCLGRPMLYELIEYAKESLTDNNTPSCACAICLCHFQDNHEFTKTECYHYFHCGCLARYIEFSLQQEKEADDSTKVECPMCRLPITYNLAELKSVACSEGNEEEGVYEPSVEIRKLQKKMSALFEKQKRKGGVIDVEQERNRFLIDITSVRQEETIPESEPPTGAESDTVAKNPSGEDTVNDSPKKVDPAKENAQPDNFSCKDKPEKRGKKEFSKYSGPSRGARRPVGKTGNQSGENNFRHNEQRTAEKKRPTTGDRPKSTNQREKEKGSMKKPEQHGSDFALWADTKPDSTQSGLESKKNTSVVDRPGRGGRGVSESTQSGLESKKNTSVVDRPGRGGRGVFESTQSGLESKKNTSVVDLPRKGGRGVSESTQSGLESKKNTSVVDLPWKGGRGVSESTQSGSTQAGLETKKNTVVVDPPGRSEKGVSERSSNSNSSQNSNEERPRSARRGRGRSGRGRPSSGSTNKSQGNANKSRTSSEGAVKQSGKAGSSEHSKPPPGKDDGSKDQRHSLQEIPDKEKRSSSGNEKVCKPPPGFKNSKVDKGGYEQSSNVFSRPPPGFEHSTRPRPPPGLGNLAEGAGQNSNQSMAS